MYMWHLSLKQPPHIKVTDWQTLGQAAFKSHSAPCALPTGVSKRHLVHLLAYTSVSLTTHLCKQVQASNLLLNPITWIKEAQVYSQHSLIPFQNVNEFITWIFHRRWKFSQPFSGTWTLCFLQLITNPTNDVWRPAWTETGTKLCMLLSAGVRNPTHSLRLSALMATNAGSVIEMWGTATSHNQTLRYLLNLSAMLC